MTPEAERVLEVYWSRGMRAGEWLHPDDFGDAIVWDRGFVRDEPVRQALRFLCDEGYMIERPDAFELTARGEREAYCTTESVLSAARSGDYRVLLVALRDRLATTIDDGALPSDLAALTRLLFDICRELERLDAGDSLAVSAASQLWDRSIV